MNQIVGHQNPKFDSMKHIRERKCISKNIKDAHSGEETEKKLLTKIEKDRKKPTKIRNTTATLFMANFILPNKTYVHGMVKKMWRGTFSASAT